MTQDDQPKLRESLKRAFAGWLFIRERTWALLLNLLGIKHPEGSLEGLDGVLIGLRTRDLLPALLEAQCRAIRVILLIEDIHWIDGASEELLRKLIESGAQSNLLIIHTRRPEYVPAWRDSPV